MVNQKVLVKDKHRKKKLLLKFLLVAVVLGIIVFLVYYAVYGLFLKKTNKIILENPIKDIIFKYSEGGVLSAVQVEQVIEEAVLEFDEDYINYILVALGINNLHKSPTFENPFIEMDLGGEIWSSEIVKGIPDTKKKNIDNEDIRVIMIKEEAVRAFLSKDIEGFMKDSVSNGNIKIEMIAGKIELFSKGYLNLYKELTGEELEIE